VTNEEWEHNEALHRALLDESRPVDVDKQHARGKLTARERIAYLLDDDGILEYGGLVRPDTENLAGGVTADTLARGLEAPADGIVTCTGRIDGRPVAVMASDFMVLGGSQSPAGGGAKMRRMAELSLRHGIPLVTLLDGAGHRIHSMDSKSFAFGGTLGPFPEMTLASGWAPHVSAVMGPSFAGPAMIAGCADFLAMVKGTSQIGMAGPKLVKAGTGEDLGIEEVGGWEVHTRSGAVEAVADDDRECLDLLRRFLGYLPSNASELPAVVRIDDPGGRLAPELRDLVPTNRRQGYDVTTAIAAIVDRDSWMELRAGYAKNAVVGIARLDGIPVGVIANQPRSLAGVIDSDACSKMLYLVTLCNTYGLPIISLIDTPGLMVGAAAEKSGLVRRSARLVVALGQLTVPFVSIVLRKGYGGGYMLMGGGRTYDSVASLFWPTAEVCAMGIEGAVDIAFSREYESAPDPAARRAELIDAFYAQVTTARSASGFGIDDVIDPAATRQHIAAALNVSARRRHTSRRPASAGSVALI